MSDDTQTRGWHGDWVDDARTEPQFSLPVEHRLTAEPQSDDELLATFEAELEASVHRLVEKTRGRLHSLKAQVERLEAERRLLLDGLEFATTTNNLHALDADGIEPAAEETTRLDPLAAARMRDVRRSFTRSGTICVH